MTKSELKFIDNLKKEFPHLTKEERLKILFDTDKIIAKLKELDDKKLKS
jgi:hypothetical protein